MRFPGLLAASAACLFAHGLWAQEAVPEKTRPLSPVEATLKEDYGYGLFTAGMGMFAEKNWKYARAAFDLAVQNNDALGRAFFHRGDVFFMDKDYASAEKDYLEALKREPDYFFAHYNLACADSLRGDKASALVHVEEALRLGYDRFKMLETDDDLKAAREGPEFAALLDKYRKTPVNQTDVTKFLLGTVKEKVGMLEAFITDDGKRAPGVQKEWKPLADKALLDSDVEVRIAGLNLYRVWGGELAPVAMVRGLFDNNGYANKFAANTLVNGGQAAAPYIDAIMASDYKEAKFFAGQIQARWKKMADDKKAQ